MQQDENKKQSRGYEVASFSHTSDISYLNSLSYLKNDLFLRRKCKLLLHKSDNKEPIPIVYVSTILHNISNLGYTFSSDVLNILYNMSLEKLTEFYNFIVPALKKMIGAHVLYAPMYPNFPHQVMILSDAELYINAIIHYTGDWLGTRLLPKYEKEGRPPLFEGNELTVINLGTEQEFKNICKNLLSSNASISSTDKEDIAAFVTFYKENLHKILPDIIPQKEILSYITTLLLRHGSNYGKLMSTYFKTATDILRLITGLSDGDISLSTNSRFRNFSRPERKFLLSLLENCDNIIEDIIYKKKKWIRIGEILHPGEYKDRFPRCFNAFTIIRNGIYYPTFNSKVEDSLLIFSAFSKNIYFPNKLTSIPKIRKRNINNVLRLLETRPGLLSRRLDHLFRLCQKRKENLPLLINSFRGVVHKVSTPVLLQIMTHFTHRNELQDLRIFFPKGLIGKVYGIKNNLPSINDDICTDIVNICKETLIKRFSSLDGLKNVYVDPELKNYIVPFSQRSASKALKTLTRGTKISFLEGNTFRFFLWWKDGDETTDIDLSTVMYDDKWNYMEHISYTNLRSRTYNTFHSGDIVSAPSGACEFIDLDIDSILNYGGRYVVMSLLSFTRQPYCDLPECFAGWMIRKYPNSGEIFEPKTVKNKIDLTADSKICIPVILDLKERKVIWADISLKSNPPYRHNTEFNHNSYIKWGNIRTTGNNVECNARGLVLMGRAITEMKKTNLYDLFMLHGKGRGNIVDTKDMADTIFSVDGDITPFDQERIMAEFLTN